MPTRGAVAFTSDGQEIYPLYNNRAEVTLEACEVDSCNQHVGGGGGAAHLHGDPFGSWCTYSEANYSSLDAHPPQIGWSLDGPSIYGRHLSTNAPGYNVALDDCGGHDHGTYGYHYHAQVYTEVTDSGCVEKSVPVGTDRMQPTRLGSTSAGREIFRRSLAFGTRAQPATMRHAVE